MTTVQTPISTVMQHNGAVCFTPCRRDANCTCNICQASIKATLDLLPISAQRNISSSKPSPPQTPIFFDPSAVSTPQSQTLSPLVMSPTQNSTIRSSDSKFVKMKKREIGCGLVILMKCVFVLWLSLIVKLAFPVVVSGVMETKLSPEIVRKVGEKSLGFKDVKEKLGFLNHEVQNLVGGTTEAGYAVPNWEIVQDGLMLRSRCRLYTSRMEEVSVWGWPLQTAGLLKTDFDSRSFTILSGTVTEWSNGEVSASIRKANTSWEQEKWSASVWRLDENTWILEYKRSFVFDNTRPFSSAMEFLRFKLLKSFQWMKQLWQFPNANHLAPT